MAETGDKIENRIEWHEVGSELVSDVELHKRVVAAMDAVFRELPPITRQNMIYMDIPRMLAAGIMAGLKATRGP